MATTGKKSPAWQRSEGKSPLTGTAKARDPESRINKALKKWKC